MHRGRRSRRRGFWFSSPYCYSDLQGGTVLNALSYATTTLLVLVENGSVAENLPDQMSRPVVPGGRNKFRVETVVGDIGLYLTGSGFSLNDTVICRVGILYSTLGTGDALNPRDPFTAKDATANWLWLHSEAWQFGITALSQNIVVSSRTVPIHTRTKRTLEGAAYMSLVFNWWTDSVLPTQYTLSFSSFLRMFITTEE